MINKKILSSIFLLVIPLSLSACLKVNTGTQQKQVRPDSGFFLSLDKGESWKQYTAILSTSGAKNFSMESVTVMSIDPSDPKTIYYGTVGQGLLYTVDRGNSWQVALSLGQGTINAVEVDPKDKCLVYAAKSNKVYRTDDCMRTWKTVFTDTDERIIVTSIDIDHFNPNNLYITLSRGDLVKSSNKGESWQTIYRFGAKIKKFVIDPSDSRRMYVDSSKDGLNRSDDGGVKWTSMKEVFTDLKINGVIVDVELHKEYPNLIYLATEKGIIKSEDRGLTWKQLPLITPSNNASIASIAVNPNNIQEIYYITDSTFYKSIDGGNNWTTKPLPTTKIGKLILMDYSNPEILYLGVGVK